MISALILSLSLAQARPPSALTVPSARGFPFLVHGPQGSDALLKRVRDAADVSWQKEIVEAGWPAPPRDDDGPDGRFDFYLDPTMAFPEAYTWGENEVTSTAWYDESSYIVLPGAFPDDAALFSTVAHELNHASQYAIDGVELDAFYEQTAVFVEQRVAQSFATYGVGIKDFQAHPERALIHMGDDWNEYGAALWLMFLSEHLGGGGQGLVQRLWLSSKQAGTDNHPHFLDALDSILREQHSSRREFFSTFCAWRYFTGPRDDGHHFAVGVEWGASSLAPVEPISLTGPTTVMAELGAFGCKLVELQLPSDAQSVSAQIGSLEAGAMLVPLSLSGEALPQGVSSSASGTLLQLAVPPGTHTVLLALSYTPLTYDPTLLDYSARTVEASVAVERANAPADAGAADAGPAVTASETRTEATSGCSVSPELMAVLAALALRMRRTQTRCSRV